MKFKPNNESLQMHVVPNWYEDAKLGIFIHWGLYSVPAFANPGDDAVGMEGPNNAEMPYAEWYYNKLRIHESTTQKYHEANYGNEFSYFDFQKEFEQQAYHYNPNEWADLFEKAGAKYVVMVTKHHDGYLMWPSIYKNSMINNYYSQKDFIGEVTEAVRNKGLKMGLYYSGVFDWTYNTTIINDTVDTLLNFQQSQEYIDYATNHYHELIDRYQPSVLWNDIGYPPGYNLRELFAYYYNHVPDGVINDRWVQYKIPTVLCHPKMKPVLSAIVKSKVNKSKQKKDDNSEERVLSWVTPKGLPFDFYTPEYRKFNKVKQVKWEMTRGIGHSFAYNIMEDESHMLTGKELIYTLADVVSKNGNILINIGPRADGSIPDMQRKPLLEMGEWLHVNGEAIYGTRPWIQANGKTKEDNEVRFTKKQDTLYVIIFDEEPIGEWVTIKDLYIPDYAVASIIGSNKKILWERIGEDIRFKLPKGNTINVAYVIKITKGVI